MAKALQKSLQLTQSSTTNTIHVSNSIPKRLLVW